MGDIVTGKPLEYNFDLTVAPTATAPFVNNAESAEPLTWGLTGQAAATVSQEVSENFKWQIDLEATVDEPKLSGFPGAVSTSVNLFKYWEALKLTYDEDGPKVGTGFARTFEENRKFRLGLDIPITDADQMILVGKYSFCLDKSVDIYTNLDASLKLPTFFASEANSHWADRPFGEAFDDATKQVKLQAGLTVPFAPLPQVYLQGTYGRDMAGWSGDDSTASTSSWGAKIILAKSSYDAFSGRYNSDVLGGALHYIAYSGSETLTTKTQDHTATMGNPYTAEVVDSDAWSHKFSVGIGAGEIYPFKRWDSKDKRVDNKGFGGNINFDLGVTVAGPSHTTTLPQYNDGSRSAGEVVTTDPQLGIIIGVSGNFHGRN